MQDKNGQLVLEEHDRMILHCVITLFFTVHCIYVTDMSLTQGLSLNKLQCQSLKSKHLGHTGKVNQPDRDRQWTQEVLQNILMIRYTLYHGSLDVHHRNINNLLVI